MRTYTCVEGEPSTSFRLDGNKITFSIKRENSGIVHFESRRLRLIELLLPENRSLYSATVTAAVSEHVRRLLLAREED